MKIKKLLITILTVLILLTNISTGYVKALTENETINLVKDHTCVSLLKLKGEDVMKTVVYVYYKDSNGKKYPAFCVQPDKDGVGMGAGDSYDVTVNQISDNVLWRMLYKGYMGTSYKDWNLEYDDDLYYATKTAVHSMAEGIAPKAKYEVATRVGKYDNISLDEVKRRSSKVLEVAQNIYDFGYSGTENYMKPEIKVNKNGELLEESINGITYITQKYNITANKELSSYNVAIDNFPKGTKILNKNNTQTSNFSDKILKIAIPKNNISYNIKGNIYIKNAQVKTYPIFYADSKNSNTQNYVTYSVANEKGSKNFELDIDAYKSKITVIKKDSQTGEKLSGIKFNAKYEDGTNIGDFTTNEKGEINIGKLKQGKVIITEIDSGKHYILDETKHEVNIGFNESATIEIKNMHKKGNIKLIKVDKDNNDVTLGAVEFDLIDEKGNIVNHIITDVNGEAQINNINTGNYILRETKTKKEYKLAVDEDIIVKWNETTNIKVENEKKKGKIRIIKIDADDREVKLEGVKFEILDKNNHVMETVVTNKLGEAETSGLPIGEYKVKESSLGTNENYILSDEIKTIIVEEDKIKNIEFTNDYKKGNLIIYKVDSDNNNIPIPNVEFEITHEDGYKYFTKSNEEGIAYIENIRKGIVMIREIKTDDMYVLNDRDYFIEINYNETEEVVIENEKKKGQIEVYKMDEENNNWKLADVEFQVLNSKQEVIETLKTDENGKAITSRLPIGEYYIKEVKTDNMHVLNEEVIKVNVETDIISKVNITNERIKGKIKIIKTSLQDGIYNNIKQGEPIPNVEFEVYNKQGDIVENLITNEEGIAITKQLDKGTYIIKEKKSAEGFVLDENEYYIEIKKQNEIIELNITNEPEKPEAEIKKTGTIQSNEKEEIKYDFYIENTGNTKLEDFTWYDYLPYEYIKIKEIQTGTYNEELNYNIYYKTNRNDYMVLAENLSTQINTNINLENIQLKEGEIITEIKIVFGSVSKDFKSISSPKIICNRNLNIANEVEIINKAKIMGKYKDINIEDEDVNIIKIKEDKVEEKKLPRTGF